MCKIVNFNKKNSVKGNNKTEDYIEELSIEEQYRNFYKEIEKFRIEDEDGFCDILLY